MWSVWLRVDPLAEKYPSISSYAYVAQNPIKYIDPNGEDIWIAIDVKNKDGSTTPQKLQYKGGKLYRTNGKEYTGNNTFATKTKTALNQIENSGKTGKGLINDFIGEGNDVTIQYSEGANVAEGRLISFDFEKNRYLNTTSGDDAKYTKDFVAIGHELAHVKDYSTGRKSGAWAINILDSELFASHIENKIRAESGEPLRMSYDFSNLLPLIDKKNGNSLYFNKNEEFPDKTMIQRIYEKNENIKIPYNYKENAKKQN